MPRIKSKKKEYMAKDIGPWVAGKLRENKVTQAILAKELGISQQAAGKKLNNSQFSYRDLLVIFKMTNATDEEILKVMRY